MTLRRFNSTPRLSSSSNVHKVVLQGKLPNLKHLVKADVEVAKIADRDVEDAVVKVSETMNAHFGNLNL